MSAFLPGNPARRLFLRNGALVAAGATLAFHPIGRTLARVGQPVSRLHPGYGPLSPVRDLTTGLPLLALPAGFSYLSFGWQGEPMRDGRPTPSHHDGMGVVKSEGDILTLVRNHEIKTGHGSFAPASATFDANAAGGTTTLRFDARAGKLVDARASLSGTLQNCAGGITPWGSWLSCEEIVSRAGEMELAGEKTHMRHDHGFVFEVPADGLSNAEPLPMLGQFEHEAAAFDPAGRIYLTEDSRPVAGFYRFTPTLPGELRRGGRLEMLRVAARPDLRRGQKVGERLNVQWVPIAEPTRGFDSQGGTLGVLEQGVAEGASVFCRLEGCIADGSLIHFSSTNGGEAGCGQIWTLDTRSNTLWLVYQSPDPTLLDFPDNLVSSPRGGLVICQDSEGATQHLYGLTPAGEPFTFARNDTRLDGEQGFSGDFSASEWCGATFSPDGRWLFANVQEPGYSVAITGPWRQGLI